MIAFNPIGLTFGNKNQARRSSKVTTKQFIDYFTGLGFSKLTAPGGGDHVTLTKGQTRLRLATAHRGDSLSHRVLQSTATALGVCKHTLSEAIRRPKDGPSLAEMRAEKEAKACKKKPQLAAATVEAESTGEKPKRKRERKAERRLLFRNFYEAVRPSLRNTAIYA